MAKLLVVLALCVVTAQSAILRNNDVQLKRIARSPCDSCEQEYYHHGPPPPPGPPPMYAPPPPPGPPPPPPGFHAHQWTGYLQSADGSHQGVFSGAAASAQDDTQASGQAFSLSSANSGSASQDLTQQSRGNAGSRRNFQAGDATGTRAQSGANSFEAGHAKGYGNQGSAGAYSEASSNLGSQANAARYGQSGGYKSHGDVGGQESQALAGASSFGAGQGNFGGQTKTTGANAVGYGKGEGFSDQRKGGENSFRSGQNGPYESRGDVSGQESQALAGASSLGATQGGFGGQDSSGTTGYSGQSGGYSNKYGGQSSQGHESGQATLQGALGLASQGLQTQQGAGSGCSTCGKTNYALSNAKSHSGNAVAVSVNG